MTRPDTTGALVLRTEAITKSFPGVRALDRVDFELLPGEVHALMGENGAGKSTLIKVLTGVHPPDAGRVLLDGEPIAPRSPQEAQSLGISTVYQEVQLIPRLSVAENLMLGRQPTRAGLVSWKALSRRAEAALGRLDLEIDLDREVGSYSTAIQQLVAIARALDQDARVLILDEPTSSLDENEVAELLAVMQRLKREELAIVFVTHFLDQVYRIADRITVLRNGARVETRPTSEMTRLELIGKMLGKQPEEVAQASSGAANRIAGERAGRTLLEAKQLGRRGAIEPFDLRLGEAEVCGFAGLLGSGRTEAARLLFGLDSATTGELHAAGKEIAAPTPRRLIRAGLAFCPEDRKREGVLLELSVRENILLAMQASRGLVRTLPLSKQREIAEHYIEALGVKTPGPETPVGSLSGGNQQKVLLARWLAIQPKLILLDEPTRGIDVGARAEIESLIASLREEGMSVVLISSELEEIVGLCDRVAVLRDRRMIGELAGDDLHEEAIMNLIAGRCEGSQHE